MYVGPLFSQIANPIHSSAEATVALAVSAASAVAVGTTTVASCSTPSILTKSRSVEPSYEDD